MKPFAEWRVFPENRLIPVVTGGLEAFCRALDLGAEHSLRLQLALEGVLGYCMHLAREPMAQREVTARVFLADRMVRMEVEHDGPRGLLDHFFESGGRDRFKRTSFEALGMYLASEIMDEMTFHRVPRISSSTALSRYCLGYDLDRPREKGFTIPGQPLTSLGVPKGE